LLAISTLDRSTQLPFVTSRHIDDTGLQGLMLRTSELMVLNVTSYILVLSCLIYNIWSYRAADSLCGVPASCT